MKQPDAEDAKAVRLAFWLVVTVLLWFFLAAIQSESNHDEEESGSSKAQVDLGVYYQKR